MRIRYTAYNFNEPSLIDENEYNILKYNYSINENYNPFPADGVWNKFSGIFKIMAGAIAAIAVGYIFEPLIWLAAIGGFIMLGMFTGGPLHEISSYSRYISERNKYFRTLKKSINKGENYGDLLKMYNRR